MNILQELKERLDACIKQRNEVERLLKLNDHYQKYLELQEEISEVSRAVKALEHTCDHRYYGLTQQAQLRGQ